MKKSIYMLTALVLLLGCTMISNAQITLEHTFNGQTSYGKYYLFTGDIDYYIMTDDVNNQVKFYNPDYSLYKSVNITPASGYKLNSASLYYTTLFNSDNKIEFIVQFHDPAAISEGNHNSNYKLIVYNEDGTIIKDLGSFYLCSPSICQINNGDYKLVLLKWIYNSGTTTQKTDIYSLPGTVISGISSLDEGSSDQFPFPNPAGSIINLPYKLNPGETAVMNIYNVQGKLIEQKTVDHSFDKIMLDVSNYQTGNYIYEVNGISNKFIVN
ncbi:MAG: T9SS type A sorting domain-containing protein [Bacteroidales bacterium]|jgi:hypothetical protein|nr:T9SS type A sorting domain-containing protein [Bacteroidales bacterium]